MFAETRDHCAFSGGEKKRCEWEARDHCVFPKYIVVFGERLIIVNFEQCSLVFGALNNIVHFGKCKNVF